MDYLLDLLREHLGTILGVVLIGLVTFLIRKTNLKKELEDAIVAFTKRVVDKSGEWLRIAMAPESDGGVKITAAELSMLRQRIWELLQAELKGSLGGMLLAMGEQRIKGMVGVVLDRLGVKLTPVGD